MKFMMGLAWLCRSIRPRNELTFAIYEWPVVEFL